MGKNHNFQEVRKKVEQTAINAQNRVRQLNVPPHQQSTKRLLLLDIQTQKVLSLSLLDTLQEVEMEVDNG